LRSFSKQPYGLDRSPFFVWANRRSPKTTNDKADALLKWNDLLEKGAISQEEYDKAKRDLLG